MSPLTEDTLSSRAQHAENCSLLLPEECLPIREMMVAALPGPEVRRQKLRERSAWKVSWADTDAKQQLTNTIAPSSRFRFSFAVCILVLKCLFAAEALKSVS